MENDDFNLSLHAIMHNYGVDTHILLIDLRVGHFVTKHSKMCSLPYAMTANKTYLSTYFPFKTSMFIKHVSLINKVNIKKCFSENYKCMHLTTRVYGTDDCFRLVLQPHAVCLSCFRNPRALLSHISHLSGSYAS